MKEVYTNVDETRCAMIVTVDYLNQCADSNRSNNLAIFPINLKVDNVTGNNERNIYVKIKWSILPAFLKTTILDLISLIKLNQ